MGNFEAKYGPISNFFSPILPEMGQLNGSMAFTDPSQSVPLEQSDLGPFFFENISFGKNLSTTKTKNKDKIKKIKKNYRSACKLSSRLYSNSKIKTNLFTLNLAWLPQANLSILLKCILI